MDTVLKVILTGSTGMVGEGVLIECLNSVLVETVLVINRRPCGYTHPKLKEIIHSDFYNLSAIESQLSGYNSCLFCLGVSSIGMKEPEYTRLTYDLTLNVAQTLSRLNTDMSFSYISGKSTDSSEQGPMMWARVKGKTENDLMKLPFKQVFAFRPGMLKPTAGQKHVLKYYRYFGWLYPVLKAVFPSSAGSIADLGQAMIKASAYGYEKKVIEVNDMIQLASKAYDV